MKKVIYSIIFGLVVTNSALAVSFNLINPTESSVQESDVKPWMKMKNGRVTVFDTALNVAIINKKTYNMVKGVKVYEGPPLRGSRIKFNRNEQNQITEVWVVKK